MKKPESIKGKISLTVATKEQAWHLANELIPGGLEFNKEATEANREGKHCHATAGRVYTSKVEGENSYVVENTFELVLRFMDGKNGAGAYYIRHGLTDEERAEALQIEFEACKAENAEINRNLRKMKRTDADALAIAKIRVCDFS